MIRPGLAALLVAWLLTLSTGAAAAVDDWVFTGNTVTAHGSGTLITLLDGTALLIGGIGAPTTVERYDPAPGSWTLTGSLHEGRTQPTATLLLDGRVLVAGGLTGAVPTATSEVYDPVSGVWSATGSLNIGRLGHAATRLPSGTVLVSGGTDQHGQPIAAAELYDPTSGTWKSTGALNQPRTRHLGLLLPAGKVLVAGGDDASGAALLTAELYDPASGTWTPTGALTTRASAGVLMSDGRVLAISGASASDSSLYDPRTDVWTPIGALQPCGGDRGIALGLARLPDGRVLALVSRRPGIGVMVPCSQLYDPGTETWTVTRNDPEVAAGLTSLSDGRVLLAGGLARQPLAATVTAQLFQPSDPVTTFVAGLYAGVLGRAPDAEELSGWVGFVRANCRSDGLRAVADAFFDSDEFRTRRVTLYELGTALYRAVLTRDPGGDLGFWVDVFRQARQALATAFLASAEFQRLLPDRTNRPAVTAVITRFYTEILGRPPDPAGVNGWTDLVVTTRNVEGVAGVFLIAPEFEQRALTFRDYVTRLYRGILGRDGESADLDAWEGVLRAHLLGILDDSFIASPEFQARIPRLCEG